MEHRGRPQLQPTHRSPPVVVLQLGSNPAAVKHSFRRASEPPPRRAPRSEPPTPSRVEDLLWGDCWVCYYGSQSPSSSCTPKFPINDTPPPGCAAPLFRAPRRSAILDGHGDPAYASLCFCAPAIALSRTADVSFWLREND
ncbi:hypothetical protein BS78_03G151100 [Paspalum vaginatum]|nr:hypothetical protein BS78_03G151100 [Paspalum vaginatum]